MAGIVRLGWSSASVAGLYRLENLLLGVLHVARRLLARGTSFQRVDAGGVRSSSRRWRCISSRRCDAFDAVCNGGLPRTPSMFEPYARIAVLQLALLLDAFPLLTGHALVAASLLACAKPYVEVTRALWLPRLHANAMERHRCQRRQLIARALQWASLVGACA